MSTASKTLHRCLGDFRAVPASFQPKRRRVAQMRAHAHSLVRRAGVCLVSEERSAYSGSDISLWQTGLAGPNERPPRRIIPRHALSVCAAQGGEAAGHGSLTACLLQRALLGSIYVSFFVGLESESHTQAPISIEMQGARSNHCFGTFHKLIRKSFRT